MSTEILSPIPSLGGKHQAKKRSESKEPPKKRGKYGSKACDSCRKLKRKCDGGHPCSFCVKKNFACSYLRPDGRQSASNATPLYPVGIDHANALVKSTFNMDKPTPITLNAGLEKALGVNNARQFYLNLFTTKVDSWLHVADKKTMEAYAASLNESLNPARDVSFLLQTAAAIAAKGCGHMKIAGDMIRESRRTAGEMFDEYSVPSCLGFILLSWFQIGEDISKAETYGSIATSIASHLPTSLSPDQRQSCYTKSLYIKWLSDYRTSPQQKKDFLTGHWELDDLSHAGIRSTLKARYFLVVTEILQSTGCVLHHMRDVMKEFLAEDKLGPLELCHMYGNKQDMEVGTFIFDNQGVKHKLISEDEHKRLVGYTYSSLDTLRKWVDAGELEEGVYKIQEMSWTALRSIVHWKAGRIREAAEAVAVATRVQDAFEIQFAPTCHLYTILAMAEFSYQFGDMNSLFALGQVLKRLVGINKRAEAAFKSIEKLLARMALEGSKGYLNQEGNEEGSGDGSASGDGSKSANCDCDTRNVDAPSPVSGAVPPFEGGSNAPNYAELVFDCTPMRGHGVNTGTDVEYTPDSEQSIFDDVANQAAAEMSEQIENQNSSRGLPWLEFLAGSNPTADLFTNTTASENFTNSVDGSLLSNSGTTFDNEVNVMGLQDPMGQATFNVLSNDLPIDWTE